MFNTHRTYDLTTGIKGKTIAVYVGDTETAVIYHNTVVVRWHHKRNKVYLSNGGWDTISTRFVINRAIAQIPGFQSYYIERKSKTSYVKSCYLPKPIQLSGEITLKAKPQHTITK